MLPIYSQFAMRQMIRKPIYLTSPIIFRKEELSLPKFTTVHYLDMDSDAHFPTRDLYYFNNTPKGKKIHIQTIMDLNEKEYISTLNNKYSSRELNIFRRENNKGFREDDVIGTPNNMDASVKLVNYNILKDLYNYRGSLFTPYYEHSNLFGTYWDSVRTSIDNKGEEENQLVRLDLPNMIPSYPMFERLITFDEMKLSRIVTERKFWNIIDLYKWLHSPEQRASTSMSSITDEHSESIIMEIHYRGYVSVLPLDVLRGMFKDSDIISPIKYDADKVLKIFVKFLLDFQEKIDNIITSDIEHDEDVEIDIDGDEDDIVTASNITEKREDVVEELIRLPGDDKPVERSDSTPRQQKLSKRQLDVDKDDDPFTDEDADLLLTHGIADVEVDENSEVDDIFLKSMERAMKTQDDISKDLDDIDKLEVDFSETNIREILKPTTLNDKIDEHIQQSKELKLLTSAQVKSLKTAKEKREKLKSPYAPNIDLTEFSRLDADLKEMSSEDIELPSSIMVVDEAYKRDILGAFDKSYIERSLNKDITACVTGLEKSGVIITDYTVEQVNTSVDNYEVHRLKLRPLKGKESTITFRIPIIDDEGVMRSGNIKQKLRKVRTDLPIRKISGYKVALSSNYGKLFVNRTERAAYDEMGYYISYIQNSYMSDDGAVSKLIPEVKKLNTYDLPNIYRTLASQFNEIHLPEITFVTNYFNQDKYIKEDVLLDISKKKLQFVGYLKNSNIVVSNYKDELYNYTKGMERLPNYTEYLQLDVSKIPRSFSILKVLGKDIPLGVCLAYLLGLTNLLSLFKVQHQVIKSRQRYQVQENEVIMKFMDNSIVLTLDTEEKRLIFNGFQFYSKTLAGISLRMMDSPNVYLNIVEQRGQGIIHLKELDILRDLFLDPITQDVLQEMKEPTEFIPLLLRANQLLSTLDAPDINDPTYSRIRGYDRVPGLMYKALSEAIREQRIKGRANSKVELDPYKVWNYIMQDNTTKIMEETNPIVDLKEKEVVTFTGRDGLQSRSTPMKMRSFHKNDIGLVSEATVDSADVALNTYLTPYAKLKNTRGMVDVDDLKHVKNQSMAFSTSAELAPMSDIDDRQVRVTR